MAIDRSHPPFRTKPSLRAPHPDAPTRWRVDWLAVTLFLAFATLYFLIGLRLAHTEAFEKAGFLFGADTRKVVTDLTHWKETRAGPDTYIRRTVVHPLFLLFFQPAGRVLTAILHSNAIAALLLNCLFGALGVALFYGILEASGLARIQAALFTCLLGVTTSQLVFGSTPETYSFSAASLLLLVGLFLVLRDERRFPRAFFPAALFSFGVNMVNLSLVALAVFFRYGRLGIVKRAGVTIAFTIAVVLAALGLSVLQNALYPESTVFVTRHLFKESRYVSWDDATRPLQGVGKTLRFLFEYNLIAPQVARREHAKVTPSGDVREQPNLELVRPRGEADGVRRGALLFYLLAAVISLALLVRFGLWRDRLVHLLASYLLFTACFHLFYGRAEPFLYSAHYTFPIVALLALPFRDTSRLSLLHKLFAVETALFLLFAAANNAAFVETVTHLSRPV